MSRIGNKIITVPEGVTVEIADDNTVTVTGSKGTLVKQFSPAISFKQEGNEITVVRSIRNRWYWVPWSNERKYISIKYRFLSSS